MSESTKDYPEKTIPECPFEPLFPSYLVRDDEFFMKLAYNQALKAWKLGEVPVGAVIEYGGEVIAQAHNTVEQSQDPTAHAEILAITQASAKIGDWRLNECDLYVTLEPCLMCIGACYNARLGNVYFGAYDLNGGGATSVVNETRNNTLNHNLNMTGGILQQQCSQILKDYFQSKRQKKN